MFKSNSDLINFDLDKETCFVCGDKSESVEHIIPKWLQKKFDLWDQKIEIPNLTHTTYKRLVVPACKKCNNEIYGALETKIKKKTENEQDIWRWANKIHFGLRLKDHFFEFDRSKPGSKIIDVFKNNDYFQKNRKFLHCVSGKFSCFPDPFGSVFIFDLEIEADFNLIHIIQSNSIYICTGDRIYIVFINDGQILKNDLNIMKKFEEIKNDKKNIIGGTLFFYAQCIYYFEQYEYSLPMMSTSNSIIKTGKAKFIKENPLDKELFRSICNRFGVTWIEKE